MKPLDPAHELPPAPDFPDLPPAHHRPGWSWLFALVIAAVAMFTVTTVLLALGASLAFVAMFALVTLVFATFLVHGFADRAR